MLLFLLALVAVSGAQVVETLGPGLAVFHASEKARDAALPSFSLIVSRRGPAGDGGVGLKPVFAHGEGKQSVAVQVPPGTALYGTGEVGGPLLRNGRTVMLWNTDAYGYDANTLALYQSHPWVLGVKTDGTAFGLLFDSTYRQVISMPPLTGGEIMVKQDGPAAPVIIIERDSPQQVVMELSALTGRMPLPPKWSLGYHQCRYSYDSETRVREIAREFRARRIPCDTLWMDIDYMDEYRIFTFDPERFPDPGLLNRDLHAEGFHTVWMINPGLKSNDGASGKLPESDTLTAATDIRADARVLGRERFAAMREVGTRERYFVQRQDGTDYEGEVWPGLCYFPDFTRAEVRTWWGSLYASFLATGVDGVWNDMNEPAVFDMPSKTMPEDNMHHADENLGGIGPHARYHNVYGMQMIRATREGLLSARPDRRPFVLSRANFLGGQRYGATWTGDNSANWEHVALSVPMVLNLGLSGQPNTGPDIGGFDGDGPPGAKTDERGKHFARWMGIGALLPFSRGHTNKANIEKEPWAFGPAVEQTCRVALERRYRLLPYLYTLFHEASVTGLPVARPLFFADPINPALRAEDSAFLLGDALLVDCQTSPNDRTRTNLPAKWVKFKFADEADDPDLPELYIRPGAIIPTGPIMQYVDEKPLAPLILLVCPDENGEASGTLYEDEGDGFGYQKGEYRLTTFHVRTIAGEVVLRSSSEGAWKDQVERAVEIVTIPCRASSE